MVSFALYYNNTGNGSAPDVWINVSASTGLAFAGDTAAGNTSGFPQYHFASVGLGLHGFQMSFVVAIGTPPGTRLSVSATEVYSDDAGALHFGGAATASVLVGVATKTLYLAWSTSPPGVLTPVPPTGALLAQGTFALTRGGPAVTFDFVPSLARDFQMENASAALYLEPLATPASLSTNLTLFDLNGAAATPVASVEQVNHVTGPGYWTFFYTFPSTSYRFAAGHRIRLQVLNAAASDQSALLATNATAEPSRLTLETTTYVTIDNLTPGLSPTTYLSPKSTLVVTANVSDPFGSAEIVDARLNLTGPSGILVRWLSLLPAAATDPSIPSVWKRFVYTRAPPLANGTYSIELTAVERNGVVDVATGGFTVRAPAFTLDKRASVTQSKSGGKFAYTIWYNDTGTGPAGTVWVNDTIPVLLSFLSSVPSPSSVSGATYGWVFSSVAVGSHSIQVNVQVKGGPGSTAYVRNWAGLNYTDERGFPWPPQMSHADVVLNGPVIALSAVSSPSPAVHSNETVVDTLSLTNTGDAANALWLNVTLAGGLTYVGDSSASLGGTRTVAGNTIRYVFLNMPSGATVPVTWSFTLTARANASLPPGTSLTSRVTLNDTSANNVLMPEQAADIPLDLAAPSLVSPRILLGVPAVTPVRPLPVYVNFTNGGNEAAATVWINLTLDPFLRFAGSALPAIATNTTVHLTLANAAVGADSALLEVTALTAVADRQALTVSGTLVASDGFGNIMPAASAAPGRWAVALPQVNFTLTPGSRVAEAATALGYTLVGGNTGSGAASAAYLNVTLPEGIGYASDTLGAPLTVLGSTYSWVWTDYAPGSRTYTLNLTATGAARDRATVDLAFTVDALDLGGHPRPRSTFGGSVSFLAPTWLLSIAADQSTSTPGGRRNFTIFAENVGSTAARTLWLVLPLDAHLQLITYTSAVPATGTSILNWTFQDVQPGQVIQFSVLVNVAPGTPTNTAIGEAAEAQYTNSAGVVLGSIRSAPAEVTVKADLAGVAYILLGGSLVGAVLVVFVYRRYRVRIEDVFLINRDGLLLSHMVQNAAGDKDEDVISGMLTAVQEFVTDAFHYGEDRRLHQLEFGDYHILIERGEAVYLAVVYQGRDSGLVRKKVRSVLETLEAAYGPVFAAWDGDVEQVRGTQALLQEGFVEENRPWSIVKPREP